MSESQQQATVVAYFKAKWPNKIIYASANGAHIAGSKEQRIRKIAKMKREGMLPGILDLCIAVARGGYHELYIEMKDVGKTYCSVSKEQRAVLKRLADDGYKSVWHAGASAAIDEIDKYMDLPWIGFDMASGKDFTVVTNNDK